MIFLLIALCAPYYIAAAASILSSGSSNFNPVRTPRKQQRRQQQQSIDYFRADDGECHSVALQTQTSSTKNATYTFGIVFSIELTDTGIFNQNTIDISSLSVYATSLVNYTLYVMDGYYIEKEATNENNQNGSDGIISSTAIGTTLDGTGVWSQVANGTFSASIFDDDDGSKIIPFSSASGGIVTLQRGGVKSFYLTTSSGNALMVERPLDLVGEAEDDDGLISVLQGYGGLNIYVGRSTVLPAEDWDIGALSMNAFEIFYKPSRFIGKLWAQLDACSPTAAPQSVDPTLTPTASPVTDAPTSAPAAPTQSPSVIPTTSLPTTGPSQSPTTISPTKFPSRAPTISPSNLPTTLTLSPTSSTPPSYTPTQFPSVSSKPTVELSTSPSIQPSTSQLPSFAPSNVPSLLPSFPPSEVPSLAPSTNFNYLKVEDFEFVVWHSPLNAEMIKKWIIGNVTKSFDEILLDRSDVLYSLATNFGLALSTREGDDPFVNQVGTADGCIKDDKPENSFNVCKRYSLTLVFQHDREVPGGAVTGWLLEVSDQISGDLIGSYDGPKSVFSNQRIMFTNARDVELKDRSNFCEGIEEHLNQSSLLLNYTILDVTCVNFTFVPDLDVRKLFRRRLQEINNQFGRLDVVVDVTGQYRPATRFEEVVREEEFGPRVEESINSDSGNRLKKSFEERQILALTDLTEVQAEEIPEPTPVLESMEVPITTSPSPTPPAFTMGTVGISVVLTCAIVALLIAAFLFHRGLSQKSKIDNEELFFEEDENDEEIDNQHLLDAALQYPVALSANNTTEGVARGGSQNDEVPAHHPGAEVVNIFGDVVGLRSVPNGNSHTFEYREGIPAPIQNHGWLGQELQIHEDVSSNRHSNFELSRLDNDQANDTRQPRGRLVETALDRLDVFGMHTKQTNASRNANNNVRAASKSQQKLDEFDALLQRNLEEHHSRETSLASQRRVSNEDRDRSVGSQWSVSSSFEERLRKKIDKGARLTRRRSSSLGDVPRKLDGEIYSGDSQWSASSTFEERLRRKADKGSRLNKQRSSSLGDTSRKLDGKERIRSSQWSTSSTFEERLRRKVDKGARFNRRRSSSLGDAPRKVDGEIYSGGSQWSTSSTFEERLRRKADEGSRLNRRKLDGKDRIRSSQWSASSSFEERLRRKADKGARFNRRRSSSFGDTPRKLDGKQYGMGGSQWSTSSTFEERLRRKADKGSLLNRQRSSSLGDTSRRMVDFEIRMQKKLDEQADRHQSRSVSPVGSEPSLSALEKLEERIRKKNAQVDGGHRDRDNFTPALKRRASSRIENFDALLQRKLEGSKGRHRGKSPVLHSSKSFEDRVRNKLSKKDSDANKSVFEERLKRNADKGSRLNRQRSSSLGADDVTTKTQQNVDERVDQKRMRSVSPQPIRYHESGSSLSALEKLEERIQKKSAQAGKGHREQDNSTQALKHQALSRIENFDALLQRKMEGSKGSQRSKSPASHSSKSFEERVRIKLLSKKDIDAKKEHIRRKGSTFSTLKERPRNKANAGSRLNRQHSSSLGADDVGTRVQQNVDEQMNKKRIRSVSPQPIWYHESASSLSALEKWEERIRKKNAQAGEGHREQDNSTQTVEHQTSFDALLQRKFEDAAVSQSGKHRIRSVSPQHIQYHEAASSLSALEKWKERIQKQNAQADEGHREQDNSTKAVEHQSSFDALLQRKFEDAAVSRSGRSPASKPSNAFDKSGRTKVSKENDDVYEGERGYSPGSASSFEERLKRKANKGHLNRQRSSSLGNEVTTAQIKLAEFDARLQRKLEEKEGRQHSRNASHQSIRRNGSQSLFSSEERIPKKSSYAGSGSSEYEKSVFDKGDNGIPQGSSSSFGERSNRKANKGGLNRQRSSSLGNETITSQRKLDDFDRRLQRKLEDKRAREHGRSVSAHRVQSIDSYDSLSTSEVLNNRVQQKSSYAGSGSSEYEKSVVDQDHSGVSQVLKRKADKGRLNRQRSSSLGDELTTPQIKLDDFDLRLQRKLEGRKDGFHFV